MFTTLGTHFSLQFCLTAVHQGVENSKRLKLVTTWDHSDDWVWSRVAYVNARREHLTIYDAEL